MSYLNPEDERTVASVQKIIESYREPRPLARSRGEARRVGAVYRDWTHLGSTGDLGDALRSKLAASRHPVVVCSLRPPASGWIEQEVREV